MQRFGDEGRLKKDALIGFFLGVVAAYILQVVLNLGVSRIFTALIVIGVGGGWYHFRKIL